MTKYRITDKDTGAVLVAERDRIPAEEEIEELFKSEAPGGKTGETGLQQKNQEVVPEVVNQGPKGERGTEMQPKGPTREETRKAIAEAGNEKGEADKVDVLLDVPTLKVDEIKLEVDNLRARLALRAELANLLRLNIGADVGIDKVELDIKGVEAQALLKVRLEQVANIISRTLEVIDNHPDLLKSLLQPVGQAVGEIGKGAGQAAGELGKGAGGAVGEIGKGASGAVGEIGKGAGGAVGEVGKGAGQATGEVGKGAGGAAGEVGKQAGGAVGEAGKQAGSAAGEVGKQAGGAVGQAGKQAGGAAGEAGKQVVGQAGQAAGETGKQAAEAGKETGEQAEESAGKVGGEMEEVSKGVSAQKGPVEEAVKGPSQGADESVQGHFEEKEQERRHFERRNKEVEKEPAEAKK